jgi:hypothetical protein
VEHRGEGTGCNAGSGCVIFEFTSWTSLSASGPLEVPSTGNIADTIGVDEDLISGT